MTDKCKSDLNGWKKSLRGRDQFLVDGMVHITEAQHKKHKGEFFVFLFFAYFHTKEEAEEYLMRRLRLKSFE